MLKYLKMLKNLKFKFKNLNLKFKFKIKISKNVILTNFYFF